MRNISYINSTGNARVALRYQQLASPFLQSIILGLHSLQRVFILNYLSGASDYPY